MSDFLVLASGVAFAIVAAFLGYDWRQGAAARRKGWFIDDGFGPLARAGWRWQDRRLRKRP